MGLTPPSRTMIARHASQAMSFFDRDIEAFEEYQRFQSKDYFGKCNQLLSFIGLLGMGKTARFVGVYRIQGKSASGDQRFIPPAGDSEVVEACIGLKYRYDLERDTAFDWLTGNLEIKWDLPANAKYIYLPRDFEITRLTGLGESTEELSEIPRAISCLKEIISDRMEVEEALAFSEGALRYVTHLKRERNSQLVSEAKRKARRDGKLYCAVCRFSFEERYGELGRDYIECHHTIPISTLAPNANTRIEDIALLCANCHRMVHRYKPWLSMAELSQVLQYPPNSHLS